jgi:cobalt/nickel transport system ATP-binding protein
MPKAECRTELTGDEIIHVDCVDHIYPDGSMGLEGICFSIHPKEIVALCGPNGSGKTTLLEHLVGILTPKKGRIVMFGKKLEKKRYKEIRRVVGFIFQHSDEQLFAPTVIDDVMFGPRNLGLSRDEAYKRAYASLETVFGEYPEKIVSKIPHYLSSGEKKLVAIAGILAMEPKVIVADEITANLDPFHSRIIENVLKKMRDEMNISIVFATHDLDMALRLADRVCIIDKGNVIMEGTSTEIFADNRIIELDLEIPQVVAIFQNLTKLLPELKDKPIPHTVEEFNLIINEIKENKSKKITE